MTRKLPIYFILSLLVGCFAASCNEDPDPVQSSSYANCAVTSFSLAKDDSVVAALDSVYFSIDLVGARIFNADSLPVGTDVSKLIIKVGTSSASACDITFPIPGTKRDTTINIIESPNDSINFSEGPVQMVVKSYDGQAQRAYTVSVNVHKEIPDTLLWQTAAERSLPSALQTPTVQKTVMYKGEAMCFTSNASGASVAVSADPFAGVWDSRQVTLPSGAVTSSIESTDDALYILTSRNELYRSTDGGSTWVATGETMNHIYGGYGSTLLGARRDADGWKHVTYPASTVKSVPRGCPVSGTSALVNYTSKWSASPIAIMIGGRDSDSHLTGESWAYDGSVWGRLSTEGIDEREGVTLFPYFAVRVDSKNWKVSEQSALYAVGGKYVTEHGAVVSRTVYVSRDFGITWDEATETMQLPVEMAAFCNAQALVFDSTLPSRVSRPVTEWECPYIYLFGGTSASGTLIDKVRRGVINRFTFKPQY